ncbi:MAG: cache domain-containing protein [Candidatus Aminicenantes bacterium]
MAIRTKLILSFWLIIVAIGLITLGAGVHIIGDGIVREAQTKVEMDLNAARVVYQHKLREIRDVVLFTALRRFSVQEAIKKNNHEILLTALKKSRETSGLDVLTAADRNGRVIVRSRAPSLSGDYQGDDIIVKKVLENKQPYASTVIIPQRQLARESAQLARQARIKLIPTTKAVPQQQREETSGMMLKAAVPVKDDNGELLGVIYGGVLLNRNFEIVDMVKDTVYKGMTYKGRDIGTATIFLQDTRISTNVKREDGTRAIGTRVSAEVYNQVLKKGKTWKDRAFVVNDWYITAYEPIRNINDKIIGILYVGILEVKFNDMKKETVLIFLGITVVGLIMAFLISYLLAGSITKPVRGLVAAAQRLAHGDLNQKVEIKSGNEIGKLGEAFNFMVEAIKERDEQLKEQTKEIVGRSERLAMIGQLAAGVAHEINNPLGSIIIFSHLLLEEPEIKDLARENLEKIVKESMRCKDIVKGLLDFARQTEPEVRLADINEVLKSTLCLVEKQTLFQNIQITTRNNPDLPLVEIDTTQVQQVIMNIIINAAEAMEGQGELLTTTRLSQDNRFVEVEFTDSGCGISQGNLKRLFEPFYTTKEVGHGTGLGLAISYGIIEKHQGSIKVRSVPGKGTTFIIQLPIKNEAKMNINDKRKIKNERTGNRFSD